MRVVLDNNLPKSLARLLAGRGFEAIHVRELGLSGASDAELRNRFSGEQIVFISRDGDFWLNHPEGWAVIWVAFAQSDPCLAERTGVRGTGWTSFRHPS